MCQCQKDDFCKHPEMLEGRKPGECTPIQIQECHGQEKCTCLKEENED
ncbi:MAG: hypothetical protein ABRQ26_03375 [Syntrophomonadaceae bacterium]